MRPATYHGCTCGHLVEWHGWRWGPCSARGCACGAFALARVVSPDDPSAVAYFLGDRKLAPSVTLRGTLRVNGALSALLALARRLLYSSAMDKRSETVVEADAKAGNVRVALHARALEILRNGSSLMSMAEAMEQAKAERFASLPAPAPRPRGCARCSASRDRGVVVGRCTHGVS